MAIKGRLFWINLEARDAAGRFLDWPGIGVEVNDEWVQRCRVVMADRPNPTWAIKTLDYRTLSHVLSHGSGTRITSLPSGTSWARVRFIATSVEKGKRVPCAVTVRHRHRGGYRLHSGMFETDACRDGVSAYLGIDLDPGESCRVRLEIERVG